MSAIIGRVAKCPVCKAKNLGVVVIPGVWPGGKIIAHTPGFGSVRPAKKRCKASGRKVRLPTPSVAKKPKPKTKPTSYPTTLDGIREVNSKLTPRLANQRLTDIATIIHEVDQRALVAAGEAGVMKATRLEMTDRELLTIYQIATDAVTGVDGP